VTKTHDDVSFFMGKLLEGFVGKLWHSVVYGTEIQHTSRSSFAGCPMDHVLDVERFI